MEDKDILELYQRRSESAIEETGKKYGAYCLSIAFHILQSREDGEECVSDTYLSAWNTIPPKRPAVLSTFLGKLTRNHAISRRRMQEADKRGGGELSVALEELRDCLPSAETPERAAESRELLEAVERFLKSQPTEQRIIFLRRYWFVDSVSEIAARLGISESKVKTTLHRTRKRLRRELEQEGLGL